jgi:adenine deaminase
VTSDSSHPFVKGYAFDAALRKRRIDAALGQIPCDLVLRGARWLDVFTGAWCEGDVAVIDGVIAGVGEVYEGREIIDAKGYFIVPGFIDSHVHIESSMMTPYRFAQAVGAKGTTSVIWDPHEIANVMGNQGIEWALEESEGAQIDIFVMVPSCVPSTSPEAGLETSGAILNAKDISQYRGHPRVLGLAEMMNWPGLLSGNDDIMAKLQDFQSYRLDGHCPGLTGKALNAYGACGIHSCHESTSLNEAQEKLSRGIHVLIREGSCAKDADSLLPLLTPRTATSLGLCSDDRNPLDIEEEGHLDAIVNKALQRGCDPVDIFRSASYSTATMYGLRDRGAIAPGYIADFVLTRPKDPETGWTSGMHLGPIYKNGRLFPSSESHLHPRSSGAKKHFTKKSPNLNLGDLEPTTINLDIKSRSKDSDVLCSVIGVRPGQIITDRITARLNLELGCVQPSLDEDILKIVVIERHHGSGRVGVALAQGFGIKSGAIATSINHDCHNIIATGSSDALIRLAVSTLKKSDGGIVVVDSSGHSEVLQLEIAGLMTDGAPSFVSAKLRLLKELARRIGCVLDEPFLQLSFLALPVIPSLKITDRGLVDGQTFKVVSVVEEGI